MFKDRFNELTGTLDLKNSVIAEKAGVDRTYISHMKSGKRIPPANGQTARKISESILKSAIEAEKTQELKKVIGIDDCDDTALLRESVLKWLYSDTKTKPSDNESVKRRRLYHGFGERLNKAMELADISNVMLSRMINVDASLISRYRSGERMPRVDSEIKDKVGKTLWDRIEKNDNKENLTEYLQFASDDIDEESFFYWLFDSDNTENETENMIQAFESFSMPTGVSVTELSTIAPSELFDDNSFMYYGDHGLQDAVIRFLGSVIRSGASEVWLYSDQNMDWMVSDPEFMKKWAALMFMCVSQKTKIRIIHNINRNMEEMTAAIKSWLPLYMSGMIEPFYKNGTESEDAFNHTLFLCPGVACIESFSVKGAESNAMYSYHTDDKILKGLKKEYKVLLDKSEKLITFSSEEYDESDESEKISIQKDNIGIEICKSYVKVTFLLKPEMPFYFRHPLMIGAFMAYFQGGVRIL